MSGMRRIAVVVLALLVVAGCSSGASTAKPDPAATIRAASLTVMRQEVPELAGKSDAALGALAVEQCGLLRAAPDPSPWVQVLKADLAAGLSAVEAGAMMRVSALGWCRDQVARLPQT